MTIVAACHFGDSALILADSRATWGLPSGIVVSDSLQKLMYVGPTTMFGYAGNVSIASDILAELRRRTANGPPKSRLVVLGRDLGRVSRFFYNEKSTGAQEVDAVQLLLGGIDGTGAVRVWYTQSPDFGVVEVVDGFAVLGSGAPVADVLTSRFEDLRKMPTSKLRVDALRSSIESHLRGLGIDSVGGLLQVLIIEGGVIRPSNYGFGSTDPDSPGTSMTMRLQKGIWIQRDERGGVETLLLEPGNLVRRAPRDERIHEFHPPSAAEAEPQFHLVWILNAIECVRDIKTAEFRGVHTTVFLHAVAGTIDEHIAVCFWGSPGSYELDVYGGPGDDLQVLHTETIHIDLPVEPLALFIPIRLKISTPGPHFFELRIADKLIGRRPLLVAQLPVLSPVTDEGFPAYLEELDATRRNFADPSVTEGHYFLEYFVICEDCEIRGSVLRFRGEPAAVYWNSFPLPFKTFLALSVRLPPGIHQVRVDLVHLTTREVTLVRTATVESESSFTFTRIHGPALLEFPEPGFYFVNAYVNDKRIASQIIAAENATAQFSYQLLPDQEARVNAGELLVLTRGAIQTVPPS